MKEADISGFVETFAQHLAEMERQAKEGIARPPGPDSIAYYVRTQRGHWGWKRETLASMSGTSLSTIERVERGDPVSTESLNRIAVALGQSPGAFTKPRVPLGTEAVIRMMTESFAPFEDKVWIPVQPLRGQRQIAELARSDFYISDASRLVGRCDESAMDGIAGLMELLDLTASSLARRKKSRSLRFRGSSQLSEESFMQMS